MKKKNTKKTSKKAASAKTAAPVKKVTAAPAKVVAPVAAKKAVHKKQKAKKHAKKTTQAPVLPKAQLFDLTAAVSTVRDALPPKAEPQRFAPTVTQATAPLQRVAVDSGSRTVSEVFAGTPPVFNGIPMPTLPPAPVRQPDTLPETWMM